MGNAVLAWSGGKDAAYTLHRLRSNGALPVRLFTTFSAEHDRSTMHGVRRALYERQADVLGLPLNAVTMPPEPDNETYEDVMARELERYRDRGIEEIVFGDLHLEDVRAYREEQLEGTGVEGRWPIWGEDAADVAGAIVEAGIEAIVVTVDADVFDRSVLGRRYDREFLADLPAAVDPCGEGGEFHTFVVDGPGFGERVAVEHGETVTRELAEGEFHYLDLEPATGD